MSMMARFVAITPDQLATIKDTPEMVGGMFATDAGLPFESPSDLLERLRRLAPPQLVADMLERLPPAVREQLRRRLGLGEDGLPNPSAGNAVLLQLAQREAARRRAPPAPGTAGHSVSSTRRGTAFITCCAANRIQPPAHSVRRCSAEPKSARTEAMGRLAVSPRCRSRRSLPLFNRRALKASCTRASMPR